LAHDCRMNLHRLSQTLDRTSLIFLGCVISNAANNFGPWRSGLSPQERLAHIRSMKRLAARHCPSAVEESGSRQRVCLATRGHFARRDPRTIHTRSARQLSPHQIAAKYNFICLKKFLGVTTNKSFPKNHLIVWRYYLTALHAWGASGAGGLAAEDPALRRSAACRGAYSSSTQR
jgi:hypothetical protein